MMRARRFEISCAFILSLCLGGCWRQARPPAPAAPQPAMCAAAAESADAVGRKRGAAVKVARPPTVDGVRDEAWAGAPVYRLAALSPEQTAPAPEDFSATFRPLWDDERLYLLIEISDDVKRPFAEGMKPHFSDQCEIYVFAGEGHEDRPKWEYGGPRQFAYEAFRAPARLKPTWKTKQTTHAFAATEAAQGWTAEVALPFAFWDFRPAPGATLGLEVHCNDGDAGPERDNHLAWSDARNEAWRNPSVIGKLTLCQ
jgi:hypothetical protein